MKLYVNLIMLSLAASTFSADFKKAIDLWDKEFTEYNTKIETYDFKKLFAEIRTLNSERNHYWCMRTIYFSALGVCLLCCPCIKPYHNEIYKNKLKRASIKEKLNKSGRRWKEYLSDSDSDQD